MEPRVELASSFCAAEKKVARHLLDVFLVMSHVSRIPRVSYDHGPMVLFSGLCVGRNVRVKTVNTTSCRVRGGFDFRTVFLFCVIVFSDLCIL